MTENYNVPLPHNRWWTDHQNKAFKTLLNIMNPIIYLA